MREIKFRAWDTRDKIYTENALPVPNGIEYHCPYDGHVLLPINERYVFEQFTGLRDKNGREIYEGDIVHLIDHPENITTRADIVVFEHGLFATASETYVPLCDYGTVWIEVIGNIHENPELLA